MDHNQVGWYQSTYMGSYCTHELIQTQFEYQENIGDNAVVVLYDPLRTTHGSFSLKAYRLTDRFMELYRVEKFLLPKCVDRRRGCVCVWGACTSRYRRVLDTSSSMKGTPIASSEIFEEVPIRIHNPPLARALLFEMEDKAVAAPVDFDRLNLNTSAFLEKKMQFLIEQVEDLADWQGYASRWERKLSQQQQQQQMWIMKRVRCAVPCTCGHQGVPALTATVAVIAESGERAAEGPRRAIVAGDGLQLGHLQAHLRSDEDRPPGCFAHHCTDRQLLPRNQQLCWPELQQAVPGGQVERRRPVGVACTMNGDDNTESGCS